MREVEVKAKYQPGQKAALITYLNEQGYRYMSHERQLDDYYNHPSRDFARTDEALRIRRVVDQEKYRELSILTYKGKNQSGYGQTREELECEIGSYPMMEQILKNLDFPLAAQVDKMRLVYQKDDISFCIDDVKGLGSYIEIEILVSEGMEEQACKRLRKIMEELSFVHPVVEERTYLDLLLHRQRENERTAILLRK